MVKKTYKVEGMHCTSCAASIEMDLEDLGAKARCNFAKETLEIEFDESKVDEDKIKETLVHTGYTLLSSSPAPNKW